VHGAVQTRVGHIGRAGLRLARAEAAFFEFAQLPSGDRGSPHRVIQMLVPDAHSCAARQRHTLRCQCPDCPSDRPAPSRSAHRIARQNRHLESSIWTPCADARPQRQIKGGGVEGGLVMVDMTEEGTVAWTFLEGGSPRACTSGRDRMSA